MTEDNPADPDKKQPMSDNTEQNAKGSDSEPNCQLPAINFATFIFSLNSSGLVHLGALGDPVSGKKMKNLPMAKQTIDILAMLQEKTMGNLSNDEKSMLKNMLYDLRMIYVKENN